MTPADTLTAIRRTHPDAFVALDQAAVDAGYAYPWHVWSHQDSDAHLVGEGATEAEALQDALWHVQPDAPDPCPDCGQTDHGGSLCPARQPHPALDPRD